MDPNDIDIEDQYNEDMENQYGQYEEMNEYEYDYDYDLNTIARTKSLENQQTNINSLMDRILEEVNEINKYTSFGRDWNLLYYHACGWKKNLCIDFIDTEQKHMKLIHYTDEFIQTQGPTGKGQCMLCCEEDKEILMNICGEEFCADCWKGHLKQRLKTSYTDPFPPCANDSCPIKTSPKIMFYLSNLDPQFKKTFNSVLCRSYATFNNFVKVCKGRPGKDCQRVFLINKMLDIIICDTCGSLVCPRCGQQSHGASYCYDLKNWKKITQDSIEFVQIFNYKICPNCKQAVERKSGCNSIVCPCKQQFCFICGQKWLPNHSSHGDESCPKYKQIMALKNQQKQKNEDSKAYFIKVEQRKNEMDIHQKGQRRVSQFKQKLPQYIKILLKNYTFYESQLTFLYELCDFQMKCQFYLFGQILSFYFRPDDLKQMQSLTLKENINRVSNFLIDLVEKQVEIEIKKEQKETLTEMQKNALTNERKQKFIESVREFKKSVSGIMESGTKLMVY